MQALQFVVQLQDGADRVVAQRLAHRQSRKVERGVQRPALGPLERDLEGGALRRRLGRQQLVHRDPQRPRQLLQLAQFEFAFAVLDDGELRRRTIECDREFVEGHPPVGAQLTDATADRQ